MKSNDHNGIGCAPGIAVGFALLVVMAGGAGATNFTSDNAMGTDYTSSGIWNAVIEAPSVTWWDTARQFRIPVTVNAASFERYEKPVEISLSFT